MTAGKHDISLSLQDVIDMTDTNNELKIMGDAGDKVSFTGANWEKEGSPVTEDGKTFDIYTNTNSSDSSVKVKVQVAVDDSII